ncbi:hypothetical protein C0991_005823 [Blastosporella zonata]|nr:hypothetical protein C0991_005823 [Blastosporella zonata]
MAAKLPTQDSDSEDEDYIPSVEAESDDEPQLKRPRTSPPRELEVDEEEKTKARDALWSSFQASVASASSTQPVPVKEMVKIEKQFQFAGEILVEVVEVAADSPDAKKWPLWHEKDNTAEPDASTSIPLGPTNHTETFSEPSTSTKPPAKRPGPRKSRTTLAAIPTASQQKAKKISTLDKSAMDWQAHIQASSGSGLRDELEANRRGGGYLEKVEFLNRVEGRREDVIEASKGGKRRRT